MTVTDPGRQRTDTLPLTRTKLAAACGPLDTSIRVQYESHFPPASAFDVQIDQEIMTVTAAYTTADGVSTWQVSRNRLVRTAHAAGAPVVGGIGAATIIVQRGKASCTLVASKNGVPGEKHVQPIAIKPYLRQLTASQCVVPATGGPVVLSWMIDDTLAGLTLDPDPGKAVTGTSVTVQAGRPTTFTLTATSRDEGRGQTSCQVSIGRYTQTSIPIGRKSLCLYAQPGIPRVYSLNEDSTLTVIDTSNHTIIGTVPLAFQYDIEVMVGWAMESASVTLTGQPLGFVTDPLGVSVMFDGSVNVAGANVALRVIGTLAINPREGTLSRAINTSQGGTFQFDAVTPEGFAPNEWTPEQLGLVVCGRYPGLRDVPSKTVYMRDREHNAVRIIVYDF